MAIYEVTAPDGRTLEIEGNKPPTKSDLDNIFASIPKVDAPEPTVPAATPEHGTQAPEWAGRHPNLYGALGAARETLGPVAEAVGLGVGGVLGGASGLATMGPVGAAMTAPLGAGLAYGGVKQGIADLDRLLGNKTKTTPQTATSDIAEGALMEATGAAIPKAVSSVAGGIGSVAKQLLGKTTGAGPGSIEGAIKGGEAFTDAMRGKTEPETIVDTAKTALNALKEQRGSAYRAQLEKLSENMEPISGLPFKNKTTELLYKFGVRIGKDGKSLDFSRSTVDKSAQKDIKEIVNMVRDWGSKKNDNTPIMLDTLKRRLDDFYSDSNNARSFVSELRNAVKKTLTDKVPEYGEMTKKYREATDLIKSIDKSLMLGKDKTADQVLRRLSSSMRENFEMRKELVQILGNKTGNDLAGQIAGYNMSPALPKGLLAPVAAGGVGLASYVNPTFLPLMATASPRVVGEFLNVFGKGLKEAKLLAPYMKPATLTAGMEVKE